MKVKILNAIKENKVIYNLDNQTVYYKPIIRTHKNKVLINLLSLKAQSLNVELYFENELIYSEELKPDAVIARAYSLSKEKSGSYRAILKTADRTYVKHFKI